jgi:hypothetical protein
MCKLTYKELLELVEECKTERAAYLAQCELSASRKSLLAAYERYILARMKVGVTYGANYGIDTKEGEVGL